MISRRACKQFITEGFRARVVNAPQSYRGPTAVAGPKPVSTGRVGLHCEVNAADSHQIGWQGGRAEEIYGS